MSTLFPELLSPDEAGVKGEHLELCKPVPWPGLDNVDLDFVSSLLARLLGASFRSPDLLGPFAFRKASIAELILCAKRQFSQERNVLDIIVPCSGRVHVFGDTHGDFHSFVEALAIAGWPSPENVLCFGGDFVDRGAWGVEVLIAVFVLKLWQPTNVFLLRGNHETTGCITRYLLLKSAGDAFTAWLTARPTVRNTNSNMLFAILPVFHRRYGFEKEVLRKYDRRILVAFCNTFRELPFAAVVRRLPTLNIVSQVAANESGATDVRGKAQHEARPARPKRKSRRKGGEMSQSEQKWQLPPVPGERRVLVVHGGLFRSWHSKKPGSMELGDLGDLEGVNRREEDPHESILEDVLWSDPQTERPGVTRNDLRGAGILFGSGSVSSFLKRNHLHGLLRAHEGPDMRELRPEMGDMLSGYSVDMELASGFVATVFTSAGYRKFLTTFEQLQLAQRSFCGPSQEADCVRIFATYCFEKLLIVQE